MVAVIERTVKVARKIDLGKLAELRDELRENPEIGLVKAENYFAEILDLSLVPYWIQIRNWKSGRWANV